uniref:Putative Fe-S oxidoreductase [Include Radical SAM domain] n=1 Tax=Magnetococcus massalia (strain MO-1) TaxID=451514 RepID=A0A1S7LJB6_MAGMO|nr:putative Fe-S oxidoreductase [Include Radical SAM domain] [Candidatus Magnetococcus massalia]
MLHYQAPLFRPPAEADSLILQATLGCSHNRCSFCAMYRTKRYSERPVEQLLAEIEAVAAEDNTIRRLFLADGDALQLPTDHLLQILEQLARHFPALQRSSCYATPANLLGKSVAELTALQEAGLKLIYLGIESGHDPLLRIINKGATQQQLQEAMQRAFDAGLKTSATVILGLGGQQMADDHIADTVTLLNRAPVHYLSTLQLFLDPEQEAPFANRFEGCYQPQSAMGILTELAQLIDGLKRPPRPIVFRSNHSSNMLPLAGNLPKHRPQLLQQIAQVQLQLR